MSNVKEGERLMPQEWIKELLDGLITCAVWAECSEYDEKYEPGSVLSYMNADNFAPSALAFLRDYCREFAEAFPRFCADPDSFRVSTYDPTCKILEYVGHDLWLTTCGHGAGFWDGDWEESIGEELSEWCRKQGNIEIYLGDDGLIYVSGMEK